MKKPTMLYASPFPPVRSGISEYSVNLVHALAASFDITLFTDDYTMTEPTLSEYKVIRYGKDPVHPEAYDYLIYNIGNHPRYHGFIYEMALQHPGYIILHDVSLYYLFVGYHQQKNRLYSAVYQHEGISTLRKMIRYKREHEIQDILHCDALAAGLSMNKELLQSGNKFIVHSDYAKNQIINSSGTDEGKILKTGHIRLIGKDGKRIPKEELYRKYHIPQDKIILGAFGFIAETKLNRETARVVREMNASGKYPPLCYVMVGDGACADDLVDDATVFKTGYVTIDEMNSFIDYVDVVVNLRNIIRGETSGSMIRILDLGKLCITNNGGWFSEIPDDCVVKIELKDMEENLKRAISKLVADPQRNAEMGKRAKAYVQAECDPQRICEQIASFLGS